MIRFPHPAHSRAAAPVEMAVFAVVETETGAGPLRATDALPFGAVCSALDSETRRTILDLVNKTYH